MADYDDQQQGGQDQGTRERFQQYPARAVASNNWRNKDDSPRGDPQPRQSYRGGGRFDSPRQSGGYGGQQQQVSETRLYVGNLLYSAQKDDIAQFFAENGFNVANLNMSIDPETGRNPSYCFVDFDTADEASRAMSELNGRDVMGRTVRISPGVQKNRGEQSGGYRSSQGQGERGGYGGRTDSTNGKFDRNRSRSPRRLTTNPEGPRQSFGRFNGGRDAPSQGYGGYRERDSQQSEGSGKRLYIGNLPKIEPQEAVEESIQGLFTSLGVEITSVSKLIAPHESKADLGGDHHFCFVDLARPEDADTAIQGLDGKEGPWGGHGSTLRVNRAREQGARRGPREGGYQPREQGGGGYQGRRTDGEQGAGGYQNRRTEGQRDWRTSRQDAGQ